jgi:hypothetical protein
MEASRFEQQMAPIQNESAAAFLQVACTTGLLSASEKPRKERQHAGHPRCVNSYHSVRLQSRITGSFAVSVALTNLPASIHPTAGITAMGQTRNRPSFTVSVAVPSVVDVTANSRPSAGMKKGVWPRPRYASRTWKNVSERLAAALVAADIPRTCGVSPEGKREESNDME